MHKLLSRQFKRVTGIDAVETAALLDELRRLAATPDVSPAAARLLSGFGDFLGRVDAAYVQSDRDLELRARSMELSSAELLQANERLREELASRTRVIESLRLTADSLLEGIKGISPVSKVDDSLESLSSLMADLVHQHEESRHELQSALADLANQKFALDQHAIVSITDVDGRITYANDKFCQISGYPREELLGQTHRLVKSDVHSPEMFAEMWETISNGCVWHGEICNRSKNGGPYWVSASIVPFCDDSGLPYQYIAIRTDISARKAMEAEIQVQLHFVRELLEAMPLPIYIKDAEGRYVQLNRAFGEFFGLHPDEWIGKTVHDLLPAPSAAIHAERDQQLLGQRGTQVYEEQVQSRDGTRRDAIYRKATLTRLDGGIAWIVGTITDITERKAQEEEFRRAKEAAEAANRAKSDFLANMSHEIRTPMNGVIGMTDLVLDTALTGDQRECLQIARSSSEALLTIINDILDFSKIESGKLLVEHISFNLWRVVGETLKTLALRAHEKGLELICDIAPDVPLFVFGDPGRLRQIIVNLVGNAIKFTDAGEVILRLMREAGALPENGRASLQFSIRDTGIGIPADKLDTIFDAFSQEDGSITRKYGGTGLGLTISSRLAEVLGGRIRVESEVGVGSVFYFSVNFEIDATRQEAESPVPRLAGRRVLVVDDHPVNRLVLVRTLGSCGMQVDDVDSGAAALALLADANTPGYDLVLLDACMPEMDGFTTAERILSMPHCAALRLLMLSSAGVKSDARRCRAIGFVNYLAKPIARDELLRALAAALGETVSGDSRKSDGKRLSDPAERALEILLVEDHVVNQMLATRLLEGWGHRVTLAENGLLAVTTKASRHFDVVLMDMMMPVMDGLEATQRIRAAEREASLPRTPIIAMTANAMQGDHENCLEAGMDDYLSKPIKAEMLRQMLQRYAHGVPAGVAGQYLVHS